MKEKRFLAVILAAVMMLTLIPSVGAAPAQGFVRLAHMALNFQNRVDVQIKQGAATVANIIDLDYKEVTAFSALNEGSYDVVFFPDGSSTAAITVPIRIDGGQYATYIAAGDPDAPVSRPVSVIKSTYPAAPPQSGNARVIVYHASAGAPAVDVRVAGTTTPVIANLAYGENAFIDVPAAPTTLEVVVAGTNTVVDTTPQLNLTSGSIYNAFAVGRLATQSPDAGEEFSLVFQGTFQSTARVRVLHAVPDAPQVDVKVDGATVLSNFGFFASSGYLDVPSGNRSVELLVAGTSTSLLSTTLSLNPGAAYTVAARGLVAGTGEQAFGVTVFNDNLNAPASGQAHVRVYHLSPDAPLVDVRAAGVGAPLVNDLPFKSASNYLPVAAGGYDLSVTTADGSATVLRTLANLAAGNIYDIFAVGTLSGTPALRLETRVFDADTGYLSAVHAAVGAAGPGFNLPVDIFVNGTQVLSDVTYFTGGPYLPLPTGFHTVEVKLAGTSTVAYSATLEIRPDSYTSLVVRGQAGQNSFGANVVDNYLNKPAPDRARLQVFHLVPGAPNVDVRVKNGPTLISDLPFGEGSGYLEVAGGTYDLEIVANGTNTVLKTLTGVQLRSGLIFEVYAVPPTGTDPLDVQLTFNLPTDAPNPNAQVRVLHAAPDAPAVDVYVNGDKALSNFTFFSSSGYIGLPAGTVNVQITPATSSTVLFDGNLILAPGAGYTVAARGLVGGAGVQAFGVSVFEDDLSAPASGQSKVRVYHLSPDAPAVDLRATGVVTPLIDDLAYLAASDYLEVAAGVYNLGVTTSDGITTVLGYRPNLMSGTIYDVFAVGQLTITTPTLNLETRTSDTDTAYVSLVHAATGPAGALANLPVDVYVDGTKALSGTTFFTDGPFLPVTPGVHTIRVTPAMSTTTVYEQAIEFAAGSYTTLIARGAFGESSFGIDIVVNDLRRPSPGNAAINVYHLVPGAPNVDVRVKNGPTLVSNLAFGQASARLEVAAGIYDLEVVQHGTNTVLLPLDGVDLRAGLIYDAYAVPFRSATEADPPLDVKLGSTFAGDVPITNVLTPIILRP